jgi:hypothetical protein
MPIYVLKAGDELSPVFEARSACSIPTRWAPHAGRALRHPAPRLTG